MAETKHPVTGKQSSIPYIVTKIPDLNLLGGNAIQTLGISVDNALGLRSIESQAKRKGVEAGHRATSDEPYVSFQRDCQKLCDEFPDLFKPELGCLKDFELEVKFKADAVPVFHKARPVPFALRDDLVKGYEGIGAVLVHRYLDGSDRASNCQHVQGSAAERNYSQIHKEALSSYMA